MALKNFAVALREVGSDETVYFCYLFLSIVFRFLSRRMAVDGIDIGFRMRLPSPLPVDGYVARGHRQETFGLTLSGEIGAAGPETAEGFLKGVFIVISAADEQPLAHFPEC